MRGNLSDEGKDLGTGEARVVEGRATGAGTGRYLLIVVGVRTLARWEATEHRGATR